MKAPGDGGSEGTEKGTVGQGRQGRARSAAPSIDPIEILVATPLFAGLPDDDLAALAARCRRWDVPAGQAVLREGEPGDALYVLVRGRLRVDAGEWALHEIRPGELFGEIAVVTRKPRTTSVYAVRDSELLVLPAVAFEELVGRKPGILREVSRVLVDRLLTVDRPAAAGDTSLVVAAVPVTRQPELVEESLRELVEAFARYGSTACGRRQDLPEGTSVAEWAHHFELASQYIVYVAGREDPEWFTSCVRQADRVLLLADAACPPGPAERALGREISELAPYTPVQVVLLHRSSEHLPHATAAWAPVLRPPASHPAWHQVRLGRSEDFRRVARLLSGRGCGIVLGGGGPRGLAHLGVMEALDDAGVPVDAVGGTSIGALMGMFRALDLERDERRRQALGGLVGSGFLFSPTLPVMSFSSGRKIRRLLESGCGGDLGSMDVSDCWLPFFCVSASITRAVSVVHDQGHLATAVRASLSLPGLLPPVRHGDDLLLDGGLLNNLPVDVMRERLDGGTVIAVDLGVQIEMRVPEGYQETPTGWQLLALRLKQRGRGEPLPSLIGVLQRAKELAAIDAERRQSTVHRADLYLRPPVAGAPSLDFRAARDLVDVGYRSALAQLQEEGWTDRRW
ncbi:MAG TPA: cyclic nucleotide-binding and patatin-like phospholipase domain-containing protein [Acidimicrobiales bacterium]|nr:cyclic nucleotide-binding and patatin-like phospholipase domain-containing protein [Acidimicrobiales bacterium]